MGATENIFAGVMIVMIFLAIVIVMNKNTTEFIVSDHQFKQEEHLVDLYSTNFNTIMLITEPNTKRSMSSLLTDAVYFRSEELKFGSKTVNVTEEYKLVLDEIYGKNKYYLEVKPRIIDVSLNFIIDGSPSLQAERIKLADELPRIVNKVLAKINETGDEIVTADVFILDDSDKDFSACHIFPDNEYVHINTNGCTVIDNFDIYANADVDLGNMIFDTNSTDYLKIEHGLNAPYDDIESIQGMREGGISDYYGSDWGTGTAYVSITRKDSARLTLLFPMGDELSTSSISEECFDIPINNFENRAKQKMCDLCTPSCSDSFTTVTEQRSLDTINVASNVATEYGHIVNPIFAYNCDYEYKPVFNAQFQDVYGHAPAGGNACNDGSCNGCSETAGDVCFHPECKNEILDQMEAFADSTNGNVIDLVDIANLDYDIDNTIKQNIEEYKFSIGEKRSGTAYVVNRKLPLPNKMMIDAKLYVYPNDKTTNR